MAENKNGNDSTEGWIKLIFGIFVALVVVASMFKSDDSGTSSSEHPPRRNSGTSPRTNESTEDTLRRVYDSQGIKYDDRMIREDARAIEQLDRKFVK